MYISNNSRLVYAEYIIEFALIQVNAQDVSCSPDKADFDVHTAQRHL